MSNATLTPACPTCGSKRITGWYNRRSESSFARCLDCSGVWPLTPTQYGAVILAEQAYGVDAFTNLAQRVSSLPMGGRRP
jgi:hypothetical protein